jgi:hypothetical protein
MADYRYTFRFKRIDISIGARYSHDTHTHSNTHPRFHHPNKYTLTHPKHTHAHTRTHTVTTHT